MPGHILSEVGWNVRLVDDEIHGEAIVTSHLVEPGSQRLRTSLLAAWADHLMGLLAVRIVAPRVPSTVELDVHLYQPAPGAGRVRGRGRLVKTGRSVLVAAVEFLAEDDSVFAYGGGSFMLAGDPDVRLGEASSLDRPARAAELDVPLAERAACERVADGVATLPRRDDALNSSNTVNGGLLALVAEESVLSLCPVGTTLSSLALRYVRPVRVGPAVATARIREGLATVEVTDAGRETRLAVIATARTSSVLAPRR